MRYENDSYSFNTASGKHCCNFARSGLFNNKYILVSIPQAVSTVATKYKGFNALEAAKGFNTASGKHCCNTIEKNDDDMRMASFNTASGKHCCNYIHKLYIILIRTFQYRKR